MFKAELGKWQISGGENVKDLRFRIIFTSSNNQCNEKQNHKPIINSQLPDGLHGMGRQ